MTAQNNKKNKDMLAAHWGNVDQRSVTGDEDYKIGTAKSVERAAKKAAEERDAKLKAAMAKAAEQARPKIYVESAFEKSVPSVPFSFVSVPVVAPKKGSVYLLSAIGPALYEGALSLKVGGFDVVSHQFRQLYSMREPVIRGVVPARLASEVRELAPPETIKAALLAIKGDPARLPKVALPTAQKVRQFVTEVQGSNDPGYLAGVLKTIFSKAETFQKDYGREAAFAAQGMLAAEYAHQMKRSLNDALLLVAYKSGYKEEPDASTAPPVKKTRKSKAAAPEDPAP